MHAQSLPSSMHEYLYIYTCVYMYIYTCIYHSISRAIPRDPRLSNSNSHMEVERTECGFYCGFLLCAGPLNHRFINMCHVFAFIKRICLPGSEISKKKNPPSPTPPTFFLTSLAKVNFLGNNMWIQHVESLLPKSRIEYDANILK